MCARNNMLRGGRRRSRKAQTGGALGMSYNFGAAITPGAAEVLRTPSCGGVARPGAIGAIEGAAITGHGLIGGRRRASRRTRRASRKFRGGRYAADFDTSIVAGTRGTYMPIHRIPCEGANQTGGAEMREEGTTAAYEFKPSDFLTSAGSPLALASPIAGRSCAMQGGRKRRASRRRASRRSNRK